MRAPDSLFNSYSRLAKKVYLLLALSSPSRDCIVGCTLVVDLKGRTKTPDIEAVARCCTG